MKIDFGKFATGSAVTWLRWMTITITVLGFYISEFFYFLSDSVFVWLHRASNWFLIPLLVFSLECLLRLRWKWISVFAMTWVLLFLFNLGVEAPVHWLSGQGFHIHALLEGNYQSRCRLAQFVDGKGEKQTVGYCEQFDRGLICDYVVYDTSAQSALGYSQRQPEWGRALSEASDQLLNGDNGGLHLYGDFYRMITYTRGPGC